MARGSVAFNYINHTLSNYDITPHNVHGVTDDTTSSRVRSPSEQYEEIMDSILSGTKEEGEKVSVLLIAQYMGTIAAHQALLSTTKENINTALVTFSPPLPSPGEVIQLPNSRKLLRHNNTEMLCPKFLEDKMGDFSALYYELCPIPKEYPQDIQKLKI